MFLSSLSVGHLHGHNQRTPAKSDILTINAGSSSIRFAIHGARPLTGKIERIGLNDAHLLAGDAQPVPIPRKSSATDFLLAWLESRPEFAGVKAIGHRIVHGMQHTAPQRVTSTLLTDLRRIVPYASEHLPRELELIEALRKRYPRLPQVACFDTAFHRTMPRAAKLVALPRRYTRDGVERYGFHGISCMYLMEALRKLDPAAAKGRVILAHLGNGSSITAVRNGRSVETSMGFTPAAGLVMSTRSGDLDPGLVWFLQHQYKLTPTQFHHMVNHEAGLLGVSGVSSDMRDLLAREKSDQHAADAIALYCWQAKKWIGAAAAVMGGVDTIVFAGGIGENAPVIRDRICTGLEFLGARIQVIPTDEEAMIARLTARTLRKA